MSVRTGPAHSVRVEITMSSDLYERWEKHLEEIGELNRSAWTRYAITAKMRQEVREQAEPEEVNLY